MGDQVPPVKKGVMYAMIKPRPLRIAQVMMIRLSQALDSSTVRPEREKFISNSAMLAARAREAFARVAKELLWDPDAKPEFPDSVGITEATNRELAIRLLDEGMRRIPPSQVRYTINNTLPFIEAYYAAGADDKGDALLMDYARTLMEYIDYYLQFDGGYYDMISDELYAKLDVLSSLYSMAGYLKRNDVLQELNSYYLSLGFTEEELTQPDSVGTGDTVAAAAQPL